MFWAETFIESVDEEYLLRALKFKTFGNTSHKLWPNILLFFHKWVVRADRFFFFFLKKKNLKLVI